MRAGFKIEYSEKRRRFVYVRIYSGTLHLRMLLEYLKRENKNQRCMFRQTVNIFIDTACSGDIVILPNDVLQLNSILGNEILLPQKIY